MNDELIITHVFVCIDDIPGTLAVERIRVRKAPALLARVTAILTAYNLALALNPPI